MSLLSGFDEYEQARARHKRSWKQLRQAAPLGMTMLCRRCGCDSRSCREWGCIPQPDIQTEGSMTGHRDAWSAETTYNADRGIDG